MRIFFVSMLCEQFHNRFFFCWLQESCCNVKFRFELFKGFYRRKKTIHMWKTKHNSNRCEILFYAYLFVLFACLLIHLLANKFSLNRSKNIWMSTQTSRAFSLHRFSCLSCRQQGSCLRSCIVFGSVYSHNYLIKVRFDDEHLLRIWRVNLLGKFWSIQECITKNKLNFTGLELKFPRFLVDVGKKFCNAINTKHAQTFAFLFRLLPKILSFSHVKLFTLKNMKNESWENVIMKVNKKNLMKTIKICF